MRWLGLALGFVAAFVALAEPASAQRRDPAKGIVCSGPTPFHCAVFGAGFNQFYEAFKGRRPPDRQVAAAYCASQNLPLLSARLRPWPGGPGNEVFVVDVTCAAGSAARSAPAFEPPAVASRPVRVAPERAPSPRRTRPSPPPYYESEAFYDDEPRRRRRPAARRSVESGPPSTRETIAREERPRPAPRRERSRADTGRPEIAETPEPVRRPEPARAAAQERSPEPAKEDASPAPARTEARPQRDDAPAGGSARPSRKKPRSYEDSITYEHF